MKRLSSFSLALIAFTGAAQLAQALPRVANGTIVSGIANITDINSDTTRINQSSDIAEINWTDFDIANGQTVQFNVPRAASLTINRVTSGTETTIAGTLNSNGQVYLINEQGVHFTNGASFDLPGLIVSTIDTFNAEADANNYAQVTFDSVYHGGIPSGAVNKLVVISPYVGFYQTVASQNLSKFNDKEIYSANRATVNFTGADNTLSVDVPDEQPDVVVPGGEKLGIEVLGAGAGSYYNMSFTGDRAKLVAKAVSVAQNIDALINLSSTATNDVVFRSQDRIANNPVAAEYALDLYSAGHILMTGRVTIGLVTIGFFDYRPSNVRIVAGKNLFAEQLHGGINNLYIEAGHNLILNTFDETGSLSGNVYGGVYGSRTIKLGSGDLIVDNADVDFTGLAAIDTYAAGNFGYVNNYFLVEENFSHSGGSYAGPNSNYAVDTYLEADNITINSIVDLNGTTTERNVKANFTYNFIGAPYAYFDDPGAGDAEVSVLTLNSRGDVNINANIDMAGMGEVNVTAVNYNINGGSTVTGTTAETLTAYVPPTPPAPPPAPDPDPAPVVPPVVETPTFEELMTETLTPERIELVKEVFFEKFSQGAKEVVAQISNVEPVTESKQSVPAVKRSEFVAKQELAENVEPTAVAAACSDGVCTVLDANDSLQIVDESYLNRYKKGLQNIVDKVVNLKGMTDIVRF